NVTGLEAEHPAPGNGDLVARLRIASFARPLLIDDKIAEPRYLHLLAVLEATLDDLEDRLDDIAGLLLRKADLLMNALDDVALGHGHGGSSQWPDVMDSRGWREQRCALPRAAAPNGVGQCVRSTRDRDPSCESGRSTTFPRPCVQKTNHSL